MNVRKNVLTVILNSSVTRRRASFHLGWVLFFFFIDVFVAPWIWTKVFYLVASCMQVSVLLFFAFLTGPGNTWTQRMVILQVTIFCQICTTGLQKLFLATFQPHTGLRLQFPHTGHQLPRSNVADTYITYYKRSYSARHCCPNRNDLWLEFKKLWYLYLNA